MTSKRGPIQCFGAGQGASAAGGSLESGGATEAGETLEIRTKDGAEFYGSWFMSRPSSWGLQTNLQPHGTILQGFGFFPLSALEVFWDIHAWSCGSVGI